MPPWEPPFLTSKVPLPFLEMKRLREVDGSPQALKSLLVQQTWVIASHERVKGMTLGHPGSVQLSGARESRGSNLELCQT